MTVYRGVAMRPGFIRYMASTDDSTFGCIALEYLRSLLRIAPVRVATVGQIGFAGRWAGYSPLMTTPMDGSFVNIVCCQPVRWSWMMSVQMERSRITGSPAETIRDRVELHTSGVHNVLLTGNAAADQVTEELRAAALRYEHIVTRDVPTAESWRQAGAARVAVIPVPVDDHDALRAVVVV